jgi:K+-transporting ATPase c subunit
VAPDGRPVALAVLAGFAVALVLVVVTVVEGVVVPTAVSQTYDAVFHYSAVASILAERDASSLTLAP